MKARKWISALAGALLLAVVAVAPASAAEYEWTFSQPWVRPQANKAYQYFVDKTKEYTNGRVEIKLYVDGLLGNHDETFHGVQDGSITIGTFSPYVSLVPGGMLNWMPWTISSWEEAELAFSPDHGILYDIMETAYNEVGLHTLFHVSQGAYGIGNTKQAIRIPADFKNLKMRVSSSLGAVRALENMGKGTGMTLATLPWSEIYNALSRGVVDGCWDMWPSLVDERHYEVMKFYTDLNFIWDAQNIAMNKDIWDKLPADLKAAVTKAATEAQHYANEIHQKAEADYIKKVSSEPGFTLVRLTDAERDAFREAAKMDGVWKELCDPWLEKHYPGQNMRAKIQQSLADIRAKVRAKK
ncbi:TRAP transporter substrate-binding protein [Desulfocurvus sp. DL9XJH121]